MHGSTFLLAKAQEEPQRLWQVSQAFRNAANDVQRSDNWLGDYCRRMKARGGTRYAIGATANKVATSYYRMVSCQQGFKPVELTAHQQKHKQDKLIYLGRKLSELKKEAA
ncbi:hypothetical protein [Pontibacter saemangeumensis]